MFIATSNYGLPKELVKSKSTLQSVLILAVAISVPVSEILVFTSASLFTLSLIYSIAFKIVDIHGRVNLINKFENKSSAITDTVLEAFDATALFYCAMGYGALAAPGITYLCVCACLNIISALTNYATTPCYEYSSNPK